MSEERDKIRKEFPELAEHGAKFERALEMVLRNGVKECRFIPSGRTLFTAVGRFGDEFIDPKRPYCSCSNFFFGFLEGKEGICYHLLGYEIATRIKKVDTIQFNDEEYIPYLKAIVGDVFQVLERGGG